MAQTVIGFFHKDSEARKVVTRLEEEGIDRDRIEISASSDPALQEKTSQESGSGIGDFFRSIFTGEEEDRHSHATEKAEVRVTIRAKSGEEAQSISETLRRGGAFEIKEGKDNAAVPGYQAGGVDPQRSGDERFRPRGSESRIREESKSEEGETPLLRSATAEDLKTFQNMEIELTEYAEVPVITKESRVVEEIRVVKQMDEHEETVRTNIRHTEIDVDDLGENKRTMDGSIGKDPDGSRK